MPPKGKTPAHQPTSLEVEVEPTSSSIAIQTPQRFQQEQDATFSEAQLQQIAELFHKLQLQSPHPSPSPDPPARDLSAPPPSSRSRLRASDIGYFHPDYKDTPESKSLVFTDIFVFTDRLLLLAETRSEKEVMEAFPTCLRGTALFWHSTELTTKERTTLSHAPISSLCEILIGRFKERPSSALRSLVTSRFGFSDIRSGRTIRSHVQEMMSHARSAEFDKEYNINLLIWQSLDLPMRAHIDEPFRDTTLAQLLGELDSKFAIWSDMAQRPPPFSVTTRQRLLPDIPDTTLTTPSGTTMPLNSSSRKLPTRAFYVDHNGQEREADLWENIEQIS
jgi:hypothetical protein